MATRRLQWATLSTVATAGVWLSTLLIVAAAGSTPARAEGQGPAPSLERTGAELYQAACAACHGRDGRGAPQSLVGLDLPLPDFTDCEFTTPEPDLDWTSVIHDGGPARAFDRRMPAFGEALSLEEIQRVIDHLRTFCRNTDWPRGELNLPRAFFTEKAFPENEAVYTVSIQQSQVTNEFLYERRLGRRSQLEIAVPLEAVEPSAGDWRYGLGDVAFAVKHAFYHDLDRGSILGAGAEVIFPTGNEADGLGGGYAIGEPFVLFGQMLPGDGFVQAHVGMELPLNREAKPNEAYWRIAAGKSFVQHRWERTWTPMVELLGNRELLSGEKVYWDVVPQMQVTLSKRQHIMINAGLSLPVNGGDERPKRFVMYLLWDWFDGGLFEAWR